MNSKVKYNRKHHQKQKHTHKPSLRKDPPDIFALSILIEVSTRKADSVQELVQGTFDARVRMREIIGVIGGKTPRSLRELTSMSSDRLTQWPYLCLRRRMYE
jgi:hypothetical protein